MECLYDQILVIHKEGNLGDRSMLTKLMKIRNSQRKRERVKDERGRGWVPFKEHPSPKLNSRSFSLISIGFKCKSFQILSLMKV